MAYDEVKWHSSNEHLEAVRDCLRSLIIHLSWWEGIGPIPLVRRSYIQDAWSEEDLAGTCIANSIIYTILRYRSSLDERGTGLRSILLSDLLCGLEWACCMAANEGIEPMKQFVPAIERNLIRDQIN